jgi:hypothetical protein
VRKRTGIARRKNAARRKSAVANLTGGPLACIVDLEAQQAPVLSAGPALRCRLGRWKPAPTRRRAQRRQWPVGNMGDAAGGLIPGHRKGVSVGSASLRFSAASGQPHRTVCVSKMIASGPPAHKMARRGQKGKRDLREAGGPNAKPSAILATDGPNPKRNPSFALRKRQPAGHAFADGRIAGGPAFPKVGSTIGIPQDRLSSNSKRPAGTRWHDEQKPAGLTQGGFPHNRQQPTARPPGLQACWASPGCRLNP